MRNLLTTGRIFFGTGIICLGIQQLYDGAFLSVVLPVWPLWIHHAMPACLTALVLITAGVVVLLANSSRLSFSLGVLLLVLFVLFQAPYLLFVGPYSALHPGLWTDPLKELALAGGAFIMAGAFPGVNIKIPLATSPGIAQSKLIRMGAVFFSITMITFGLDHFLYTETVASMVPGWLPAPVFWAYLAGAALMAAGAGIMFNLLQRAAAFLLGSIIFIWFLLLHLPAVLSHAYTAGSGAAAGAFEALSFSGIALVLACYKNRFVVEEKAIQSELQ